MATHLNTPSPYIKNEGGDMAECNSHREREDNYKKVIIQLAPRWRIIECKNALQWIIQHRATKPLNQGYWLGVSYITTRNKLIEVSKALNLLSDASISAKLSKLPNHINQQPKN